MSLAVSWDLHGYRGTPGGVSCFFVVPKAMDEASQGPLKGAESALKALQGSKTETKELLGGMEEKISSLLRGH